MAKKILTMRLSMSQARCQGITKMEEEKSVACPVPRRDWKYRTLLWMSWGESTEKGMGSESRRHQKPRNSEDENS